MKIRVALGTTLANDLLTAIKTGTAGNAVLEIYDGSAVPAIGDTITDTLLASFDLGTTVGTVSNGVFTLSGWTDEDSAPASGTVAWARILDQDGNTVLHMSASGPAGSGEVKVDPEAITAGKVVSITSAVIRMPV